MKCEICNEKEATLFYEETVNGKTRSFHLCRGCAEKLRAEGKLNTKLPDENLFSVSYPDILSDIFGLPRRRTERVSTGKTCPACGATWQEIATHGKAFCPECYSAFGEELTHSIRSIHGNVTHTGRTPAVYSAAHEKENKLAELKAGLKAAIETENFEEAARLRDEIRGLAEG